MDINEKMYPICWKIYEVLEGNEVIETLVEDYENILQILSIRKLQQQKYKIKINEPKIN
jgi:hypothetical protein